MGPSGRFVDIFISPFFKPLSETVNVFIACNIYDIFMSLLLHFYFWNSNQFILHGEDLFYMGKK